METTIIYNVFKDDKRVVGTVIASVICVFIPFLIWKLTNKKKDIKKPDNN